MKTISIPGKPVTENTGKFNISISAGVMINFAEWIPSSMHYSKFEDLYAAPYKDIRVSVQLDDKVLVDASLDSPVNITHIFNDSKSDSNHCLLITISGLSEQGRTIINGIGDFAPMVRIESVEIENLSLRNAFEEYGTFNYKYNDELCLPGTPTEFVGFSGTQMLAFKTPIYRWLLDIDKSINYFK